MSLNSSEIFAKIPKTCWEPPSVFFFESGKLEVLHKGLLFSRYSSVWPQYFRLPLWMGKKYAFIYKVEKKVSIKKECRVGEPAWYCDWRCIVRQIPLKKDYIRKLMEIWSFKTLHTHKPWGKSSHIYRALHIHWGVGLRKVVDEINTETFELEWLF